MSDTGAEEVRDPTQDRCFPNMNPKAQIITGIVLGLAGLVLVVINVIALFFSLGVFDAGSAPIWLTVGVICCLLATCFFYGAKRVLANLKAPDRIIVSIILVVSMVLSFFGSDEKGESTWYQRLFAILEVCCVVWLFLSYFPKTRVCCIECCKGCWNGIKSCCGGQQSAGGAGENMV